MLQVGQRLGEFQLICPLGNGGMGQVYEAQQFNPLRRVALKVLGSSLVQNSDALHRFRREVEVLAELDHPSIVQIISAGQTDDGILYYTMKLIRGVSLAQLIRMASVPQSSTGAVSTVPRR